MVSNEAIVYHSPSWYTIDMAGFNTQGIQSTTQQYLEIYDITNDLII
jgi:hypothetical protein